MKFQLIELMLSTIIVICKPDVASAIAIADENASSVDINSEAMQTVSSGLNQFAANFYKTLASGSANNLICSPISASMALSMTAHGAAGITETEMRTGLYLPNNKAMGLGGFRSLIDSLNEVEDVKLSVANKIYIDNSFTVKQEFKDVVRDYFKSEAQNVDFASRQESSGIINTWCSEKTENLIKDVIKPDDLIDAVMVLVNAVYFKGIWKKKFNPEATTNKPFHSDGNTTNNDVPMMTQVNKLNYGQIPELDAVYVEIPYQSQNKDDVTSMFIIRPNEIEGLKKAQENIDKIDFKQLHKQEILTRVRLFLPKFKIESTLELKPILKEMGMSSMFDRANFSGITEEAITISKVIQKAFIEVNEEGSEAAAATAVITLARTAMYLQPEPLLLTIDRPFIYAIYHAPTNTTLFQGHIRKFPV